MMIILMMKDQIKCLHFIIQDLLIKSLVPIMSIP